MNIKTYSIIGLLSTLFLILLINPLFISNLYNTILGRIILIFIVLFCASYNVTMGLLASLILILSLNKFILIEGLDNQNASNPIPTPDTVGSIDESSVGSIPVVTRSTDTTITGNKKGTKNYMDDGLLNQGIDVNDIQHNIQPMSSNSIPIDAKTMTSSENVTAHTPSMLNNSSSLTETFCPCAASVF